MRTANNSGNITQQLHKPQMPYFFFSLVSLSNQIPRRNSLQRFYLLCVGSKAVSVTCHNRYVISLPTARVLSLATVKCVLQLSIRRQPTEPIGVKLEYPMIILLVHESPGGRTLPSQGIGTFHKYAYATEQSVCIHLFNIPAMRRINP